ncbi:MAG: ChaN family lipoprotein [Pseudobdellovibrionaceae bacterium]|nr:ChaN family lipoprotein [Pseudobdellovibrionaceae bacterium]
MRHALLILSLVFSITSARAGTLSWNQTLWNPAEGTQIHPTEFDKLAGQATIFVLGEEHYNPPVQVAEAWLINRIAHELPKANQLILGWEFLNTEDRFRINEHYAQYKDHTLSSEEFLQQLFPAGPATTEYAPVLESARAHGAALVPTNLSRAQKSPVTRGGIEALDPTLLPKDFTLGGPLYWERFQQAMGPHPLPYPIENYFAAQSLTDEVMATELLRLPSDSSGVLITGAFHGDYRQGVVTSLERRSPNVPVVYIRIVDAQVWTEDELRAFFVHSRYGPVADLLYVVNEPRP